ncbi:MAG: hypothetical protein HRF43_17165 [Phycisphaerae bacterium]|jgi:hypothetical protein
MARKRDYPIVRFLIGCFYVLAGVALLSGFASGGYLWMRAENARAGSSFAGPLASALSPYSPAELRRGAVAAAGCGAIAFLLLGGLGQLLAMQRDQAMAGNLQTQLLEDILELNEEAARTSQVHSSQVDLCEGCGRLGSLQQIESGQWICRECRRQLRSA